MLRAIASLKNAKETRLRSRLTLSSANHNAEAAALRRITPGNLCCFWRHEQHSTEDSLQPAVSHHADGSKKTFPAVTANKTVRCRTRRAVTSPPSPATSLVFCNLSHLDLWVNLKTVTAIRTHFIVISRQRQRR